jgi:hypothetical protein
VEFSPSESIVNPALFTNLVVSEIHYHPLPPASPAELSASPDKNDFEFVELKNIGATPLDLSDVGFTTGIVFNFPADTVLESGRHVVIARNAAAFAARYGTNVPVAGTNTSGQLENAGERLVLSFGVTIPLRDFAFDDVAPWPITPDGLGPSLSLRAPNTNPNPAFGSNWTPSSNDGGSPGADEPAPPSTYEAWVQLHFSPAQQVNPAVSGINADPDADGFNNLSEFGFATNPLVVDQPFVRFTWATQLGTEYPGMRIRRPTPNNGLAYELLASNDLSHWTVVATSPTSTTNLGSGVEEAVFRDNQPRSAAHRFLRLRVSLVP